MSDIHDQHVDEEVLDRHDAEPSFTQRGYIHYPQCSCPADLDLAWSVRVAHAVNTAIEQPAPRKDQS